MDPVPQFVEPLAPYVDTRDEVLKIRRALTLHLQSQIAFVDDEPPSHLLLCSAHNVEHVKDIPPELGSGLRAQYLRALSANVAARKQYNAALEELTRLKEKKRNAESKDGPTGKGQELLSYLSMLRARREREKVQIFRQYLAKLNDMEAAQEDYLSADYGRGMMSYAHASGPDTGAITDGPVGEDVDAIVYDLERTTLLAQQKLNFERTKRDAQKRQESGDVDSGVKLKALIRVRDELVQWAEESLASAAMDDGSAPPDELAKSDCSPLESFEEKRARIQTQYEKYLASRQALLRAIHDTTAPLPTEDTKLNSQKVLAQERRDENSTDPSMFLPYASRNLLPLSKAQKSTAMQRSYASAMLEKQKWTSCKVLGRLQDESHLLPKYPMHEKQSRLKHALDSITNRRSSFIRSESEDKPNTEMVGYAEAWVFASAAAGSTTSDFIEGKLDIGAEMSRTTEDALREVYQAMDRDYDEATTETERQELEGKLTPAARAITRRKSAMIFEKQVKSPWSALSGKVGVIGDK